MFSYIGALIWPMPRKGLIVGSSVMAGPWLAKRFVMRIELQQFRLLMDALMPMADITMRATAMS